MPVFPPADAQVSSENKEAKKVVRVSYHVTQQ